MVWTIDSVSLPSDPSEVIDSGPAYVDEQKMPSTLPFLIGFGRKARKITATGMLFDVTKTKAQLFTDVVSQLQAKIGKVVVLSGASTQYNGSYILGEFTPKERKGFTRSYDYTLTLLQGSNYVVL